jgi:hypothetical protein
VVFCLLLQRMCALARQNARSDRVCLDFSLLRFFVSRQRNEEEIFKILLLNQQQSDQEMKKKYLRYCC